MYFTAKGKVLDASQEMLAVGMCNIVGSFVSSIPVNASFSRAAVSNASGARTTFSGIYTGKITVFFLENTTFMGIMDGVRNQITIMTYNS